MKRLAKLTVMLFGIALCCQPASAFATEFSFDAGLSLTGNCSVSTDDPVPDPGLCPMPPGVAGVDHPSLPFTHPEGVATDSFGDIYVSSRGTDAAEGAEGRIDVFSPTGTFISELKVPTGPRAITVDAQGNLYIFESASKINISRCVPTTYEPLKGKIEYGACVVAVKNNEPPWSLPAKGGFALNPANGHLFVHYENFFAEYGSAEEGFPVLDEIGKGVFGTGEWVALDAEQGRIYASDSDPVTLANSKVRVFELAKPHALLKTITSCGPKAFSSSGGNLELAVDESNGHFFVGDLEAKSRVYEFNENYECLATVEHKFQDANPSAIAVDNSATSPNHRDLFVTSGLTGLGHSYVFEPVAAPQSPEVEAISVGEVGENEAQLRATISAGGAEAHYTFEYTTQQSFEAVGFAAATVAGEGDLTAGTEEAQLNLGAGGLEPGTAYRFRARVESEVGSDGAETIFGTYPEVGSLGKTCANEALRGGFSAALPDCRAYELVTPPDTNGRTPLGAKGSSPAFFSPTLLASPQGGKVTFKIQGGALPGSDGTGAINGENYRATRAASGWDTTVAGPSGAESQAAVPGSPSPDQAYSFWITGSDSGSAKDGGSAVIDHEETSYVRYPDGHSELIGRGSLGSDSLVRPHLITEGASHIIFDTTTNFGHHIPLRLEEDAPPAGTLAVYDRTADEVTHVVSLLPGDKTPGEGEDAKFEGASSDGAGIAFEIDSTLYLRVNNEESFEVATDAAFAGVSEEGRRVFYVKGGNLFAFDSETKATVPFATSGDATVVNVAADGTSAYFVSPSVLPVEANPNGELPQVGEENLYRSEQGGFSFVGTVTERDVKGGPGGTGGLGLWTAGIAVIDGTSIDPSRTTPDGSVLLFESRAPLTGFDSGGKAEVFRYDQPARSLRCLSCDPTLRAPGGDASLQSNANDESNPLGSATLVPNLRGDGARAFFQSSEPLVAADTDQHQDVYEWEEKGIGSCTRSGGCVYLVSSGHSPRDDYLYGISASGDDVFFISPDVLVHGDSGAAVSIYDARVNGGFAEEAKAPCQGEGCHPGLTPPPVFPSPEVGPSGNIPPSKKKTCPKSKQKARRHGKVVCVKKDHRHPSAKRGAGK